MYIKLNEEIKKQLMETKSPEDVKALMNSYHIVLSDEEARDLYEDMQDGIIGADKLSAEEIEVIQGGRDYIKDGCCATVEYDSWCGKNDSCMLIWVRYDHAPVLSSCPYCYEYLGSYGYHKIKGTKYAKFKCPKCKREFSRTPTGGISEIK
ncbi:MAG: hypothetical protein IKE16_10690 [Solobacterium sp.]|nr:hypothetical protein [Solobacterium sp.]